MSIDKKKPLIVRILKNPFTILGGMVLGLIIGALAQMDGFPAREAFGDFADTIAPVGQVYLDLLRMTIFPILISAIVTSIGKIFGNKESQEYLGRIVIYSLGFLLITSIVALLFSAVMQPGTVSEEARITLGRALTEADQTGQSRSYVTEGQGIFSFFEQMIPQNIFASMGTGASLQILFFSILLGVATGIIGEKQRESLLGVTEALFKAFFTIIEWIMYLLPFGLLCLLAGQIANTGLELIFAMGQFILVVWVVALLLFVASAILISLFLKVSIIKSIVSLKDALLIAFGTQSTFASMPAAIDGLSKDLDVDEGLVNLVIPLGAVVSRFSMVILYGVATFFAAQLYDISLGITEIILAVILVVLAAIAGAGTPGIVSLAMISIVFGPLGLPSTAIVVLLLAVNPVIEPVTTMTNIFAVAASTAVIAGGKKTGGALAQEA